VHGHGAAIPEIHDIGIDRARGFQYITPTEVKEAATKCSVHKAHPAGDVFPAMFKRWVLGGGADILAGIYNNMIDTDSWPEDWGITRAVLLHKGGEKVVKRFRIVVVDWFCRKLPEKILSMRIGPIIEEKCIRYQFGFRKRLTCGHMVHALRLISEKSQEWGRDLYMMKHDILGAFDYINHRYLLGSLRRAGVDEFTAVLVVKLAAKVRLRISSSVFDLGVITCTRGIKQGGLMSPELFNLVVAVALEFLEEWACNELAGIDMTFVGVYIPSTLFADDFIIIAVTLIMIKRICEYIMKCLIEGETGLDFNWEKCELITNVVGSVGMVIVIWGREVTVKAEQYTKILGSVCSAVADSGEDFRNKLSRAASTNRQLRSLCDAARTLPYKDKVRLMQTTTLQGVLWNIESLGLSTDQCRVLHHLQTVSARMMLRIRALADETSAQYIHRTAGVIKTVADEHGFKNWHDLYLERLHKWPCRILNDGSLTGEVLCWRDARWSANEQLKGKQAIRRPSRKRFKRWEDPFVKSFGLDWKTRARLPDEWAAGLQQFMIDKRCR